MRLALLGLAFAMSCGDDAAAPSPPTNACEEGRRIHGEALAKALDLAPPCASDADCVVMHDEASCPGRIDIDLCDLAVHRRLLALYDPREVSEAMCEATEGAVFGCSIQASCAVTGPPICVRGECVFADP